MNRSIPMGIVMVMVLTQSAGAESTWPDRIKEMTSQERQWTGEGESAEPLKTDMGLKEYWRMAWRRNQRLRAAFYQWKAALKKVPQVFSLPDPMVSFTEYVEAVETRVGSQERAFAIQQKIPLPDKLWIRKSRAFKSAEALYYRLEQIRLQIMAQVAEVYYEYLYLRKAISLTEENMTLLGNFEQVAQARYASGLTKNQDLLKVQVELGKLENDLLSLRARRPVLEARMNALLNLPETTRVPWPEVTFEELRSRRDYQDMETLMARLKAKNPRLLSEDYRIQQSEEGLKLAKRSFFPDLTVGVKRITTGDALNPSVTDSGKDPMMVTLSVNVPIWFSRLKAGVEEAQARVRASMDTRQATLNDLTARLAMVHYQYTDALRQVRLYRDGLIPKAVQSLNATKTGYEGGKADFLSLIDAQRMLLSFQLAYYRYEANRFQMEAKLAALVGEVLLREEGERIDESRD